MGLIRYPAGPRQPATNLNGAGVSTGVILGGPDRASTFLLRYREHVIQRKSKRLLKGSGWRFPPASSAGIHCFRDDIPSWRWRDRMASTKDRQDRLKLKLALRAAKIGIWDWDLQTQEMTYSARARSIFGFPPAKPITFEMVRDATHPGDYPRTSSMARRALDPEIRAQEPYTYRLIRADTGEIRWVEAHGEAVFSATGAQVKAIRYVGTIEDITDRIRAEESRANMVTRLQLAIEASGLAVWEYDILGGEVRTSPELNRLYGFPPDASPTIDEFRARYLPGEQDRVQAAALAALESGEVRFECEFRVRHLEGSPRWLLLRAEVRKNEDDQFSSVIGVVLDIDDRKRAEDAQTLLARELNHRVKNSLAVVQALVRQNFRSDIPFDEAVRSFQKRIGALASANDILVSGAWSGFSLRVLVERITAPYMGRDEAISFVGVDCHVAPRFNVPLALVLHELCTNAAKYGALSVPEGRVDIQWTTKDSRLHLAWTERGGPSVAAPTRQGFGSSLIERHLAPEFDHLALKFEPDGVRAILVLPEAAILELKPQIADEDQPVRMK
jgi:PAS domain S-box-containing protein